MNNLDSLLEELAYRRRVTHFYREEFIAEQKQFQEYTLPLQERIAKAREAETEIEEIIRKEALQAYLHDPEHKKEIHSKIHERDVTLFHYAPEDALEWCIGHRMFLTTNEKQLVSFLRSLKGQGIPNFVQVEVKPTITIAQEL